MATNTHNPTLAPIPGRRAALPPGGRAAVPTPPPTGVPHLARRFNGLDLSHDPAEVFPGLFTRLDNLRLSFGKAVTRPGFAGLLAAKHGAALYGLTEYRNSDQTTTLLYDTGGRIYKLPQGASADTEVTVPGSGSLSSAGAQYAQLGKYKYRVDGAGPLLRIDPTGGTAKLALTAPPAALTASLASTLLDDWGTGTFTPDTLTGSGATNRVTNPDFAGGGTIVGGNYTTMPNWTRSGSSPDWKDKTVPSGGGSRTWAIADTPGDGWTSAPFNNDAQSLDASRQATSLYLSYDYFTETTADGSSVLATAIAYAGSGGTGGEVGRVTHERAVPPTGDQSVTMGDVFEFGDGAAIGSWAVFLQAGAGNKDTATSSPLLTHIVAYPFTPPVAATPSGLSVQLTQAALPPLSPASQQTLVWSGLHVRRSYGTAKDLRGSYNTDIPLGAGYPAGLRFRLRLHASGAVSGVAAAWYSTNAAAIDADTLNATVDISTVPLGVLQSVDMIEVVFLADAPYVGPASVTLGPLRSAGDLSVAPAGGAAYAPYSYAFTELDDSAGTSYADPIESNPSPVSTSLTATGTQAQVSGVLPAATNGTATAFGLYRFGGVFSDGAGRLVGVLPVGSDTPLQSDAGFLSWNHTTRTFTDNTPDSWLEITSAALLDFGRDAPPAGMTAVCHHQGRIWGAKAGRVYASWLVTTDTQNPLYMNQTLDPTDPNRELKGDTFPVGGNDNDAVTALISFGQNAFFEKGYLVAFKASSVYIIGGTGPGEWYQEAFLVREGVGCVGPNACGVMGGRIWFNSQDGVRSFAADFADPKSISIDKGLLAPSAEGGCDPAAWAKSALVVHDCRVHVCVPTPGDSAPTVKYVYDSRQDLPGGWTVDRAVSGSFVPAFTGGCTLTGGSAAGGLYWAGQDGQVYREAGALDKALSSSAGVGVSYAVATRGVGQEGDGLDYWREQEASWWLGEVSTSQRSGTVTCGVLGENGLAWSEPYSLRTDQDLTHIRKDVPSFVRGRSLIFTLSGTATAPQEIQAIGGVTAAGGLR